MAIIFGPDAFVVSSNTNINAYPSGSADYAYSKGTGTNMLVNAANDRVELTTNPLSDITARCINAAVSATMGDQEARANIGTTAASNGSGLAVRYSSTTRGYIGLVDLSAANEIQIWEDNAGMAMLTSKTGSFGTTLTSTAAALRATGGAGSTALSWTVGIVSALTTTDTTAPATGSPGIYGYTGTTAIAFIDDFVVDDLITPGAALPKRPTIVPQAVRRASSW